MGARNRRLLRVSNRVAAVCCPSVWAVLLSVQLQPRQPGHGRPGRVRYGVDSKPWPNPLQWRRRQPSAWADLGSFGAGAHRDGYSKGRCATGVGQVQDRCATYMGQVWTDGEWGS